MMENPLLQKSPHFDQAQPWDQIRDEHFGAAFDIGLGLARDRLKSLRENSNAPDYANTLEALESATEPLDLISHAFHNLLSARTSEKLQETARTVLPLQAELSNDIYLDDAIFARVQAVFEAQKMHPAPLTSEQTRLLEKTYRAFVRNGARLGADQKKRLREIDARLALLTQQFGEHVLKATQAFALHLTDEADLAGLPQSVRESAAHTARERGHTGEKAGWVITLDQPSLVPFMQQSERRELREKLWRASSSRAMSGPLDNRPLVLEIVNLKRERAQLLGYPSHAHFVLEERMATHPETVNQFLDRMIERCRPAAKRDLDELQALAGHPLAPWDVAYYSERLKKQRFDLDDEILRPYFPLDQVIQGVFEHARRLYGLKFLPRADLPVYHPDVQVFEARDEKSDEYIGLFYTDFHPRASKRPGAWATTYRDQGTFDGQIRRPHVSIVCNLTRPTADKPSLLGLEEVRTVFHEFGHALHMLLSRCQYRSLGGANVEWDFVELPSQIMENWVKEKEGLDLFAAHYKTGEKIPSSLIQKIKDSARFQAGWTALRQLNFGTLDQAWYAPDARIPSSPEGVEQFEVEATARTRPFDPVPGTSFSCAFGHIFAGGYDAGYYSYKWAEVLDADAFEYFQEKGIFNPEVSGRFKDFILSRGGSEHPMELYRKFRGRAPDPDALMRRDGLL